MGRGSAQTAQALNSWLHSVGAGDTSAVPTGARATVPALSGKTHASRMYCQPWACGRWPIHEAVQLLLQLQKIILCRGLCLLLALRGELQLQACLAGEAE